MALPIDRSPNPIRPTVPRPDVTDLVNQGLVVKTNRTNQGSWTDYLNGLRRNPTLEQIKAEHELPGEKNPRVSPPQMLNPRRPTSAGSVGKSRPTTRKGTASAAGKFGAAQDIPAGQNTANYAAGLRRYGASARSAPNVGPVRNKAGYNERDARAARANGATLATGDEMSRVRLLGG